MTYDQDVIDLCISILLKSDISVVIGYEVNGDMKSLRRHTAVYNTILNGRQFLRDGTRFDFPKGKFYAVHSEREAD